MSVRVACVGTGNTLKANKVPHDFSVDAQGLREQ